MGTHRARHRVRLRGAHPVSRRATHAAVARGGLGASGLASVPARRLEALSQTSELRQRLAQARAALARDSGTATDAARFLRHHRLVVDASLRELWRESRLPRQLALV